MTTRGIDWFRTGQTLNACYNAVDRHVIRGRADHLALVGDREYSYARLLTEVGAFAGAMHGIGVSTGDEVLVGGLPPVQHVVVTLACARLGVVVFDSQPPAPALAVLGTFPADSLGDTPVITADVSGDLTWEMAMTAGRTDPAGCADVLAEAPLRVFGGRPVPTAEHLLAVADGVVDDDVFGPLLAGGTIRLPG